MPKLQLIKRKNEIPDDDLVWLAKNGFRPHPAARGDEKPTVVWAREMRAKKADSASSRGAAVEVRMEQSYAPGKKQFFWTSEVFAGGSWFKGEDPSPERAFEELQYNLRLGIPAWNPRIDVRRLF